MNYQYSQPKDQFISTITQNKLDVLNQSIDRVEKKVSTLIQILHQFETATAET